KMSRQQSFQYIRCQRGDQREMAEKRREIAVSGVKYLYLWRLTLVRRGVRASQRHEPALAVFPRAAGQHDVEVQPVDVPAVLRVIGDQLYGIRPEQVLRRVVVAMLVLDPAEERELVIRPHVELERLHAWPPAVVHAFGVLPVGFAARLPVAFEQRGRAVAER